MRTRRLAVSFLVVLALAGCANKGGASPGPSSAPGSSAPSLPAPSASASASAETISGTVSAGVEPHCLIMQDAKGSHVLIFDDPSLRAAAPAGADVTLAGYSSPRTMTTCQQGVAFIVTAVRKN